MLISFCTLLIAGIALFVSGGISAAESNQAAPVLSTLAKSGSPVTSGTSASEDAPADIILRGGSIVVGDGSEPWTGHVAIRSGRIVALINDQSVIPEGHVTIDCSGLTIAPGFIDLHNHSDDAILSGGTRSNINFLLQGCTTVVTGNCGSGPVDAEKYLAAVDTAGAGTHVAHLLPQGSLRAQVMGVAARKPTDDELQQMLTLAEKAMRDGVFGMSTGLIYIPGTFTETDELTKLTQVVASHKGIYASHIRNEGDHLLASVAEALKIGTDAGVPVHISHIKASGGLNWGTMRLALQQIQAARDHGQQVTADQYPYIASSTSLDATLLPSWAREGGRQELQKRLEDPETAAKIRSEVARTLENSSRIQLASCRHQPRWIGKSLTEIADSLQTETVDVVLEIERNGGAAVVNFAMSEEDLRLAMNMPWVATASDGGAKIPDGSQPHPRSFGTFPRKIGYYAVDQQLLSLSAAIRSATGLPAEILGLTDRGLLAVGKIADVCVFDAASFRDRATFDQPWLPPSGMRYVLVNGQFAVYDGQATGALAGRAIRKQ
jgi:N-acyl-D-amino-acid deacylase